MSKAIRLALARRLLEHGIEVDERTQRSTRMVHQDDPQAPGKTKRVQKEYTWQEECIYWGLYTQGSGVAFDGRISQDAILAKYIASEDWTTLLQLRWCIRQGLDVRAKIKSGSNSLSNEVTLSSEDISFDPDEIFGPVMVDETETMALLDAVESMVKEQVEAAARECYDALSDYFIRDLPNDGPRSRTLGPITVTVKPTQESRGGHYSEDDAFTEAIDTDDAYEVLFGDERTFAPYRFEVTLATRDGAGGEEEEELDIEELTGECDYVALHSERSLEQAINELLDAAMAQYGPKQTQPALLKKAA